MRDRMRSIAVAAGLALACASGEGPQQATRFDPEVRLDEILGAWRALPTPGLSCEARPSQRAAVTDCGRLRGEVEALALEFPQHPRVRLAAAAMARDARDPIRALSHLDQLLAATPIAPDAVVLRAQMALEEGNLALARRVLREQIVLVPDHAGLREAEAGVAYLSGDRSTAYAALDAAAALGAPRYRVAYHRGLLDEAGGDRERALEQYRIAIDAAPGFAPARERLAGLEAENAW